MEMDHAVSEQISLSLPPSSPSLFLSLTLSFTLSLSFVLSLARSPVSRALSHFVKLSLSLASLTLSHYLSMSWSSARAHACSPSLPAFFPCSHTQFVSRSRFHSFSPTHKRAMCHVSSLVVGSYTCMRTLQHAHAHTQKFLVAITYTCTSVILAMEPAVLLL